MQPVVPVRLLYSLRLSIFTYSFEQSQIYFSYMFRIFSIKISTFRNLQPFKIKTLALKMITVAPSLKGN